MELRQGIEYHRARLEIEEQRIAPGRERQRAMRMLGKLGQPGRAAGMEKRRHRVLLEFLGRHQPVAGLLCQGLLELDHADLRGAARAADAEHFQTRQRGADRVDLRPDVREDRGAGRDQRLGLGFLHDARDLRGIEEVVHRVGNCRHFGAPEREEGLGHGRHQQGHGIVRPDTVRAKEICRLEGRRRQLLERDVAHRILRPRASKIADGRPALVGLAGMLHEVEDVPMGNVVRHRHFFELGDIGLRADLHGRFPD